MNSVILTSDKSVFEVFKKAGELEDNHCFYTEFDDLFSTQNKEHIDFIFVDIELLKKLQLNKKLRGPAFFKGPVLKILKIFPSSKIVLMAQSQMSRDSIYAIKAGAHHFLTYPLNKDEIHFIMEELTNKELVNQELNYLQESLWDDSSALFHSANEKMLGIYNLVKSVAPTKSTVLLTGESGTGKSLLAKKIHDLSNRRNESFVSVHCGALSESLIESELFGHEKGAFTGAIKRKLGKFELAHKGTIFLDEIGTVSPQTQVKLLKVLQEKLLQRVGGEEDIEVDVRIIAATNIDIKKLLQNGEFREDLYYRLNVFPIELIPLRERKEDIPSLVKSFIEKYNRENLKEIEGVDDSVLEAFFRYPWPGNIRELENIVERAFIVEKGLKLEFESIPRMLSEMIPTAPVPLTSTKSSGELLSLGEVRKAAIESIERNYLKELLKKTSGKINKSSEIAGVTTRQLHKLLSKYDLKRSDFSKK